MDAARVYAEGLDANSAGRPRVALSCFLKALEMEPARSAWVISAANMHGKLGEVVEARAFMRAQRRSTSRSGSVR